jgi:glycosyltransferase involved in cell wall biosynthesis
LFRSHKVEQPIPVQLKTATAQELIAYVNTQASKIQTMQATVDIDTAVGGEKKGQVTEYQEIRGFGLRNPVAVIPNGIDLPEPAAGRIGEGRIVLSLGRIHPKKGLDRLIRAWAQVERRFRDWRLRIIGPADESHDEELRALTISLGLSRISIEGPLHGKAKTAAYREAEVFVLPTLNENFGLTVAEALACELPVISTKGAPWKGLAAEGCGWWIEHGVEPLAAALAKAMMLPPEVLRAMGARGRAWMARDFSWDRVARPS